MTYVSLSCTLPLRYAPANDDRHRGKDNEWSERTGWRPTGSAATRVGKLRHTGTLRRGSARAQSFTWNRALWCDQARCKEQERSAGTQVWNEPGHDIRWGTGTMADKRGMAGQGR